MPALDEARFEHAVKQTPFLQALSRKQLEQLRQRARLRQVGSGRPIWSEGDATAEYTFLIQGRAKLVRASEAGREAILDLCRSGDLLCSSAVSCFAPYCCSATSLDGAAEVLVIPRRDLHEVLERSPEASRAFARELAGRELRLARRIEQLSSGTLARRIAALLLHLADESGSPQAAGSVRIPIALKRQDLADLCSARLETTIRVMRQLAGRGIVRSLARGFLVDRPALERIVRGD
jgi:CRP-like cAMP-binding protein